MYQSIRIALFNPQVTDKIDCFFSYDSKTINHDSNPPRGLVYLFFFRSSANKADKQKGPDTRRGQTSVPKNRKSTNGGKNTVEK